MPVLTISIPEPQSFDSLLSLKGRCAVVTGGSRGLGGDCGAIGPGWRRGRADRARA
jgi:hypothetical protein